MDCYGLVIGVSAGGLELLLKLLPAIPVNSPLAVLIVQHVSQYSDNYSAKYLNDNSKVIVKEAEDKEKIESGIVYLAPANYHLLVDYGESIALSTDEKVNFSRPSIDVLFHSAAEIFGQRLMGLVLTGANYDGSKGLKYVKSLGGLTIVQNPLDAEASAMPKMAISVCNPHLIYSTIELQEFFKSLNTLNDYPLLWASKNGLL